MLKQSTARNVLLFMTDSADHVTGKTGLTLTLTASKDGGAFAGIAPGVTERGSGWYSVALTAAETDTLGDLAIHATGAGADPTDIREQVFLGLPGDPLTLGADSITAAVIAADAVAELQAGLATGADLATVDTVVDAIKAKTDSLTFTVAGQVDANIQYVNDVLVTGDGQTGTEWGP